MVSAARRGELVLVEERRLVAGCAIRAEQMRRRRRVMRLRRSHVAQISRVQTLVAEEGRAELIGCACRRGEERKVCGARVGTAVVAGEEGRGEGRLGLSREVGEARVEGGCAAEARLLEALRVVHELGGVGVEGVEVAIEGRSRYGGVEAESESDGGSLLRKGVR